MVRWMMGEKTSVFSNHTSVAWDKNDDDNNNKKRPEICIFKGLCKNNAFKNFSLKKWEEKPIQTLGRTRSG